MDESLSIERLVDHSLAAILEIFNDKSSLLLS